ncbi:iron complex transport system substrate-binding protein [Malonomonas rubra DSM 5091]|uniref:Iron complex transport system substrate-binding protein n=1 Tax=Malonomonas rubra DSM 5091 TaxID=1122189 RepID=A0A1M6NKN7_MALRU|nr:ABC transporter substrate-binding protein [Malonomonas rubra]SHJ96315.1 iron complex transport system substrate-binding protein [Malonomonas rubra DSM 5091]
MSKLLAALLLLLFSTSSFAAQRIVILAPAAADIIEKLDASEMVVGKTRNVEEFPQAQKVGSHIRPNLELITALDPDLLIISSNKFFSQEMAKKIDAELFYYTPETLEEILQQTSQLAQLIDRKDQALKLIGAQWQKLKRLEPIKNKPKVIYEITEVPLTVAGSKNIIADIIKAAGGIFINTGHRKMLRFNPEAILAQKPNLYIWQVGPMNQAPSPPAERGQYRLLQADYLQVDQLQFSRANTRSFDNVLELNTYFHERQN